MKKSTSVAALCCLALSSVSLAQNRIHNGSFEVYTVNSSAPLTTVTFPTTPILDYWSPVSSVKHTSSYGGFPAASNGRGFITLHENMWQGFDIMPHDTSGENLYVADYGDFRPGPNAAFSLKTMFQPHCDPSPVVNTVFAQSRKKTWFTGAACFHWADGANSCGMAKINLSTTPLDISIDNLYLMNVMKSTPPNAPAAWSAFNNVSSRGTINSLFASGDGWKVELQSDCPGHTGMIFAVRMPMAPLPSVTVSADVATIACTPKGSDIRIGFQLYNPVRQGWTSLEPILGGPDPRQKVTATQTVRSRKKTFSSADPYAGYLIPSANGHPCGLMLVKLTFSPAKVIVPVGQTPPVPGCFGVLVDRAWIQ